MRVYMFVFILTDILVMSGSSNHTDNDRARKGECNYEYNHVLVKANTDAEGNTVVSEVVFSFHGKIYFCYLSGTEGSDNFSYSYDVMEYAAAQERMSIGDYILLFHLQGCAINKMWVLDFCKTVVSELWMVQNENDMKYLIWVYFNENQAEPMNEINEEMNN